MPAIKGQKMDSKTSRTDRVYLVMPPSLKSALEAAARGTTAYDWGDDDESTYYDLEWALDRGLVSATRNGEALTSKTIHTALDKDTAITLTDRGRAWLSVARLSTPVRMPG